MPSALSSIAAVLAGCSTELTGSSFAAVMSSMWSLAQLQHPDLLAVTGFPCPGRMVLGLLFTTGWLAILNY